MIVTGRVVRPFFCLLMFLLSLDTSNPLFSVALLEDGRIRTEISLKAPTPQSADHLGLVDLALRTAGKSLADVDAFACTIGPGGFTGLRVGLSLLKGFTADGLRPLYGISTLHALARTVNAGPQVAVVPCLDARRKEIYAAVYIGDQCVVAEDAYEPDAFSVLASAQITGPSVWVGEGSLVYRAQFEGAARSFASGIFDVPRGAAVAQLAYEAWLRGERPVADKLVPNYLRASEAERNQGSKKRV